MTPASRRYELRGNASRWRSSPIDLSQYARRYWFTRLQNAQYLLLPKTLGLPVFTLEFGYVGGVLEAMNWAPLDNLFQFSFQGALSGALVSDRSMHTSWVFCVQPSGWDWLQNLRLDGSFTGVYPSIPVPASMQQKVRVRSLVHPSFEADARDARRASATRSAARGARAWPRIACVRRTTSAR